MSNSFSGSFPAAPEMLAKLSQAIGNEHVRCDAPTLSLYARSTHATPIQPLAVLFPNSRAEICKIIGIILQYPDCVGVYPISCGKNFGYGDAAPLRAGGLVLDLGRMNRIVEVNEKLGYAVIEPGVTQAQMYEYLKS
ncbi:MAG: FAD-dependent oxidoreductase, partial [Phycisphaerae bacterium]